MVGIVLLNGFGFGSKGLQIAIEDGIRRFGSDLMLLPELPGLGGLTHFRETLTAG